MHTHRRFESAPTVVACLLFTALLLAIAPAVALADDSDWSCSHSWSSWSVLEEATIYAGGSEERYCDLCGLTQERAIPKRQMNTNERKAVKLVTTYLKAAKKYDWKKMNRCFVKATKKYGYPTDKAVAKYHKKYNKRMLKWTMVDVKKSGKTYYVYVSVRRPDGYDLMHDSLYRSLVKCFKKHYKKGTLGTKAAKRDAEKAGSRAAVKYAAKLKSPGIRETIYEEICFPVVKRNGKWKIKKKSMDIVDVACCGYNDAKETAIDDFESFVDDYL